MANKFKVDLANLFTNWNDDVGAWATSSGGVVIASHPVAGDLVTLDGNSGNLVVNVPSACSLVTTSGYMGTLSGSAALELTGDDFVWDWGTGTVTYNGTITITDASGGSKTFSGGGKTYGALVIAAGSGDIHIAGANTFASITALATVLFDAATTVTGAFSGAAAAVSATTLTAASVVTSDGLDITDSTLVLTGTGTICSGSLFTDTSTIQITNTSATGKTFAPGGDLTGASIAISSGSGVVTFSASSSTDFGDINGWTTPLTFTGGAKVFNGSTVMGGALVFTGVTATFLDTLTLTGCPSITGGTWNKASGTVTAPANCLITNNTAQGGATFDGSAATNGGGNSGWTGLPPVPSAGSSAILNILLSEE